ncbi:MAG: DUF2207 domain-containing protein, partial [Thermomonas sp.]
LFSGIRQPFRARFAVVHACLLRARVALALLALCLLLAQSAAAGVQAAQPGAKVPQKATTATADKAAPKPATEVPLALPEQPRRPSGDERILGYDIDIKINADGSLDVTEILRVHAAGNKIRRGIYRDFPTRYPDRYGNDVVVGFKVIDLQRDGKPEPWFTEDIDNGVRVNFGNDDLLPVPADYSYALTYRTDRQIGFFSDHDELYWNAIGNSWEFRIEQANVTVHLPQAVAIAAMRAEGYTGPQFSNAQGYRASIPSPGTARWALAAPLAAGEGMTIVLSFPKGVLTPPSGWQKTRWLLKDNPGPSVMLATLLLVLGWQFLLWLRVGRDPKPGVIIARYEPPAGHSPAGARFLQQQAADELCFSTGLLALAVKGLIRITVAADGNGSPLWTLTRTDAAPGELPVSERRLLDTLFGSREAVTVDEAHGPFLRSAQTMQSDALKQRYGGMHHDTQDTAGCLIPTAIGAAGFIAAFILANGWALWMVLGIGLATAGVALGFWKLTASYTAEGRKLLDEFEGLKTYLSVADRDDLARLQGPDAPPTLDGERYAALLPWAIALGVEAAWTAKFTAAVGSAMASAAIADFAWIQNASASSLAQLNRQLNHDLNRRIAKAAAPPPLPTTRTRTRTTSSTRTSSSHYRPGSSSGRGGGGYSGGGGGGGGGGGR